MRSAFVCFLFLLVTSLTMGLVATKPCTSPADALRLPATALVQDVVDSVEELWDDIATAPVCSSLTDAATVLDDGGETMPAVAEPALAPLPLPHLSALPATGALPARQERLLRPPTRA